MAARNTPYHQANIVDFYTLPNPGKVSWCWIVSAYFQGFYLGWVGWGW